MFNKYRVITITKNLSDGESHLVDVKDTFESARDIFLNRCSSYGTNPQTKTCEVLLLNSQGDVERTEKIDRTNIQEINKRTEAEKALREYMLNPTDENLNNIKTIVTDI